MISNWLSLTLAVLFISATLSVSGYAQDDASIEFEKELYEWGETGRVIYSIPNWDGDPKVTVGAVRDSRKVLPGTTGRMSFAVHPGEEGRLESYGRDPSRGRLRAAVSADWPFGLVPQKWPAETLYVRRFTPELGALTIQGGFYQDVGAEIRVVVTGADALMKKYARYGGCAVEFIRLGRIHPGGARQLDKVVQRLPLEEGRDVYSFKPEFNKITSSYTDTLFDQLLTPIGPHGVRLNCFDAEFAYEDFRVRFPQGFKVIVPKEDGIEIDEPVDSAFSGYEPVEYSIDAFAPLALDIPELTPEQRKNLPPDYLEQYDKMIAESKRLPEDDGESEPTTAVPTKTRTIDSPDEFQFYVQYPARIEKSLRDELSVKIFKISNEDQQRVVETIAFRNLKSSEELEDLKDDRNFIGSLTPDILECGEGCLRTRLQTPFTKYGRNQAGDYEIRLYWNGFYILDSRRVTIGSDDDAPAVSQVNTDDTRPFDFASYSIAVKPVLGNAKDPLLTSSTVRVEIAMAPDSEPDMRLQNLHLSVHHKAGYTYGCQAYAATESRFLQSVAVNGQTIDLRLPSEAGNYELRLYANSPSDVYTDIGRMEFGDLVAVHPIRVVTPYGKIKVLLDENQHFITGVNIPAVNIEPSITQPPGRLVFNHERNTWDAPIYRFGIYDMGMKMPGGVDVMPLSAMNSGRLTQIGGDPLDRNPISISVKTESPFYEFRLSHDGLYYDRIPFTANNTFVPDWPNSIRYQKSSITNWIEDDDPLRRESTWLMNIDECANYVPTETPRISMVKWQNFIPNTTAGTPNDSDDDQDGPPIPAGSYVQIDMVFYGHPFYLEARFTKPQPHKTYQSRVGDNLRVKMMRTQDDPLLYRSAAITLTHDN